MNPAPAFQVELWQLVTVLITFFGAVAACAKVVLDQMQKHLDERFGTQEKARQTDQEQLSKRLDGIEQSNREESDEWQRIERDFLRFQADLPLHYVRRDDYIRGQSIIEAKLDGLASKLENAQLRAMIQGNKQ